MPRRRFGDKPWRTLLENPDLKRWHTNVAQGSQVTADVYLRRLGAVSDRMGIPILDMPTMREKEVHTMLLDFIAREQAEGKAGSAIHSTVKAVKSWLLHNGIKVNLPVKVRGAWDAPTLKDERTPSQEELRQILLAANSRDRVSCILMANAGVRPGVIGNYTGNDGLRLKDLPEIQIKRDRVEFSRSPAMVVVRAELSKTGQKYFSFLSEEGCGYVKAYLEERLREGEKLSPESDLVRPQKMHKAFLTSINVGDGIREAIRGAGFDWRPYVLRAYFDTQLLLAESQGKVAHDFRVFWMGHKGTMDARYTTNKGRLTQTFVDEMREAYGRCEPYLTTSGGPVREDVPKEVARSMLELAGFSDEEIERVDLSDKERVRDLVRERISQASAPQQEVIDSKELPARLASGWSYVDKLNDHQVVVTSPPTRRTSPTPSASSADPRVASRPVPLPGRAATGGSSEVAPRPSSDVSDRQFAQSVQARPPLRWGRGERSGSGKLATEQAPPGGPGDGPG